MRHAHGGHNYGDTARDYLCTQLSRGVHSGHRAHRRGLLQLCPLVGHLDRREFFGGGSTVGAWGGSEEYVRARSHEIWGHRTHPPSFGWEGVSECKESAGRTHAHNARSELPASATWAPGSRRGSEAGAAGHRAGRRTRGCEGQGPGEASLCSRSAKSILACNDRIAKKEYCKG